MSAEEKLLEMGLSLPVPEIPGFNYVPITRHADTLYLSAQIAKIGGTVQTVGRVGETVTVDEAKAVMRLCALQGFAWLRHELGSLNRVQRVLRMNYYICCVPGCTQMSDIADVGSGLFVDVFGSVGRHARTVLGVVELPRNVPCMFDATFAIDMSAH